MGRRFHTEYSLLRPHRGSLLVIKSKALITVLECLVRGMGVPELDSARGWPTRPPEKARRSFGDVEGLATRLSNPASFFLKKNDPGKTEIV
jgi:hypothetical protein